MVDPNSPRKGAPWGAWGVDVSGQSSIANEDLWCDLWSANFAPVRIVDVSDDYRLHQSPLPGSMYPVILERWMPLLALGAMPHSIEIDGYLYDWHESPFQPGEPWTVAVVQSDLAVSSRN